MNILLVGNAGNFMRLMINRLNKEGHRVFVLTEEPKKGYSLKKVFEVYHFSYEDACVREVLESIMPQVVVFLGAYDHTARKARRSLSEKISVKIMQGWGMML